MDDGDHHRAAMEDIFTSYRSRRSGIIKALTTDEEILCLYGTVKEQWLVKPPEKGRPLIPEPASGINFARNMMEKEEWLRFVATRSDLWLLSISFFFATKYAFDRADRKQLFTKINDLPTVLEALNATAKDTPAISNNSSTNSDSITNMLEWKPSEELKEVLTPDLDAWAKEKETEEQCVEDHKCSVCGESEDPNPCDSDKEPWNSCNNCVTWFHTKCVDFDFDNGKLIVNLMSGLRWTNIALPYATMMFTNRKKGRTQKKMKREGRKYKMSTAA
ncbi:hypothetical protein LguiA_003151 [Lonicera macranthoides]